MIATETLDRLQALKATLPKRRAPRMSQDDWHRWTKRVYSCERKTAFVSRMAAEHRLQKLIGQIKGGIRQKQETRPVAVYQCANCHHFHLTGVPQ